MNVATAAWTVVCPVDAIVPAMGVCALVEGTQVAVFRLRDGSVHAIANRDPFSGAQCLSRGILGDAKGIPVVASPAHKQRFDLRSGACLDDPGISVPVFDTRVRDGQVAVRLTPRSG